MASDKVIIVFILITLYIAKVDGIISCNDTKPCPAHKPYCTEAGCVLNCPDNFNVDGNKCVYDCGEMFVGLNGVCIEQCHDDQYYRESVKAIGRDIIIDKKCVQWCNANEFLLNKECVEICPPDRMFLDRQGWWKGICMERCPSNKNYKVNITVDGFNYTECRNSCNRYISNGFCIEECKTVHVIEEKQCLSECPLTHQVLVNGGSCYAECSPKTFNISCACPSDRPFIENETCVERCSEISSLKERFDEKLVCVPSCSNTKYMFNASCVDACPAETYVYNMTCNEHCPANTFHINTTFGVSCSWSLCKESRTDINCVESCPDGMYIHQRKCVEYCNIGSVLQSRSCIESCTSKKRKKIFKYTVLQKHYDYRHLYIFEKIEKEYEGFECVENCQENEVIFNETCYSVCPPTYPFVTNRVCQSEKCNTSFEYVFNGYTVCTETCAEDTFSFNGTCVHQCDSEYKVENTSCVRSCSSEMVVVNISKTANNCSTWCEIENYTQYLACKIECPSEKFLFNRTCLYVCPENSFAFNGSCVEKCPSYYPYMQTYPVPIKRWRHASSKYTSSYTDISANVQCVALCSEPYNILDNITNTCVLECPADRPFLVQDGTFDQIYVCVVTCPIKFKIVLSKSEQVFNNIARHNQVVTNAYCAENCTNDKPFIHEKSCVSRCPSDAPFVSNGVCKGECTNFYIKQRSKTVCVDECPEESTLINNKSCVSECPAYIFQGECVSECPLNVRLVYEENYKQRICTDKCPGDYLIDINTLFCIYKWKCSGFSFNGTCVNKCPTEWPYHSYKQCVKNCGDVDEIANATCNNCDKETEYTCISKRDCRDQTKIIFANKCLSNCPSNHVCFKYVDSIFPDTYTCMNKNIALVVFVVPVFVLLVLLVRGFEILKQYSRVIILSTIKTQRETFFANLQDIDPQEADKHGSADCDTADTAL
ncbi:hypothetical protein MAR_011058 [Mya arenaria]|uniref:Uncharacterized protein n=1 Tax=Mya arenaria TaxID=6604 RepID=A0ABY7FWU3_MYAAR|nr:hypothetical protein MAR_011058 [Mya arenaria]